MLSNSILHDEYNKFGSLNLDTPRSRYGFLKFVFKSIKNKKIKTNTQTDRWGPLVSMTHASVTPGKGRRSDQPYLTDGKITDDEGDTSMFPSSSRVGWW